MNFIRPLRDLKFRIGNFCRKYKQWLNLIRTALLVYLCLRLFYSLVLLIGLIKPVILIPNEAYTAQTLQNLVSGNAFEKYFLSPWFRWDTVNYLGIAENGYSYLESYTVWPPLYPFLIKIFSYIFKPPLFAAIIVSNFFLIISIILFLKLFSELFGESVAKESLFYLFLFPTSFYLLAPYTESIFLALSLALMYAAIKKKWLIAGVLGGFAALTRVQGILLVIPALVEGVLAFAASKDRKTILQFLPAALFAPLTYGLYCLYVRFGLMAEWPWVSLNTFWGQRFAWPWEGIIGNLSVLLGTVTDVYAVTHPLVHLVTVIVTVYSIFFFAKAWKKMPLSISLYSLAAILLVLCKVDSQSFMVSTMRYLLPIFPIFIGQAMLMNKKWLKVTYFAFGLGVNIIFIVFNYWWIWVA
jgi:Gpi18-like mannosyltransferase